MSVLITHPEPEGDQGYWAALMEDAARAGIPDSEDLPVSGEMQPSFSLDGLNEAQRQAVTLSFPLPVMVVAGAGTGKTAVLTRRIAYLVHSGVRPEKILAVTFTNKAAGEMRDRLAGMGIRSPAIGTFHSIGLQILKTCPEAAGLTRGFSIMSDSDSRSLWRECFLVPDGEPIRPGEIKLRKSDPDWKQFERMMFSAKDAGARCGRELEGTANAALARMLDVYEEHRKKLNMADFSDLISASLAVLRSKDGGGWRDRFEHVLVDEFQDTSLLQYDWVTAFMSGPLRSRSVFCVGDDCQSIYAFRGANVGNMNRFVKEFGAREVLLEQNYRCGSRILTAANHLIARNPGGDRKKLWTENPAGEVTGRIFEDDAAESRWIAGRVIGREAESAVLVRSRISMIPIAKALRDQGIPYHLVGAHDFFDSREIKDALALVRFHGNPFDRIAFLRFAGIFPGVGKKTIQDAFDQAPAYGGNLLDTCRRFPRLATIQETIEATARFSLPSDVLACLVMRSGLMDSARREEGRAENLEEFIEMAMGYRDLRVFMEELALVAEPRNRKGGVTVSTIHAAKGLEWKHVYLPGLAEGRMPLGSDDIDLEEERRLMYVAITRAESTLAVTFHKRGMVNGEYRDFRPSRFLFESRIASVSPANNAPAEGREPPVSTPTM